ncbi:MAG: tetratricopeptide repeat protein [Sphingomonadales bacterium]
MESDVGSPAGDGIREVSDASFIEDVLEPSRTGPVVVAFGPGRSAQFGQLTAALKMAVKTEGNGIGLCALDTDYNLEIASQIGLRELPAVVAFMDGKPADGFSGLQPANVVRAFVRKLAAAAGPPAPDLTLEAAREAFAGGDVNRAISLFDSYLQSSPGHPQALAGMVRCLVKLNDFSAARAMLDRVPAEHAGHGAIAAARSALELAEQVGNAGDVDTSHRILAENPGDLQARFDLALALLRSESEKEAMGELLEIVRRERDWNDKAARQKLLALFDSLGAGHPLTISGRRELSSILFS